MKKALLKEGCLVEIVEVLLKIVKLSVLLLTGRVHAMSNT